MPESDARSESWGEPGMRPMDGVGNYSCVSGDLKPGVLSPFLTGRMFVRRTYLGQFDEL